ncbi:MAG: hypothetical protein C4326_09430 [Ignavibacteria bacterium]
MRYLDFLKGNVTNPYVSVFANVVNTEHLNFHCEASYLRKGASETFEIIILQEEDPSASGTKTSITHEIALHYIWMCASLFNPNMH